MPVEFNPKEKQNKNCDIEIDKEGFDNLKKDLTKALMASLKDQVIYMVIPSLSPGNFRGEAINYMKENKIPITEKGIPAVKGVSEEVLGIKQYSELMYKAFKDNVDNLIMYDEENDIILISPFIDALEFGDYYRPLLKTITRAIENCFIER